MKNHGSDFWIALEMGCGALLMLLSVFTHDVQPVVIGATFYLGAQLKALMAAP
jgi:hypothetical protein